MVQVCGFKVLTRNSSCNNECMDGWTMDHAGPRAGAVELLTKHLAPGEVLLDGKVEKVLRERLLGPVGFGVLFFVLSAGALAVMYCAWVQRREHAALRARARKYMPHVRGHPRGRDMIRHLYDAE